VTLRFQLAIYGLIPAWAWLAQMRTAGNRGTVRKALAWLVGALPLLLLQFYAWRVVYGRWFVFTYGAEGERFNWSHPEISNVLFSPYHGLFYWHPFLVVGLIGLGWLAFKMKGVLSASLLAFAGTVYVNAAWWCWWFAGNSFGSRAFEAALLFFMGGLAYLFVRSTPRWRRILFGGAMLAVVWNLYLMVLFYGSVIDRNAPVTWTEMIQAGPHMLSGSSQSRTP
jgi:hypothetical protein